jgi:hypothetical protein
MAHNYIREKRHICLVQNRLEASYICNRKIMKATHVTLTELNVTPMKHALVELSLKQSRSPRT